ncbi:hypothetical protein HPDFL43_04420 [Hoeflea phototrophica DFL-43]|jgi:hypothetical protein|uniref:DUF2946 domain-containing protein n=1 Tax=Hoeflea phototrophica (strain DSM 17068 / NCIMB 14078 / DFL-43) TaxID=411684 RepID=A9D3F2_HOEPD|nr:hypothetical protein [Hoeflea phototrophica]EDQ33667.1 hypothetical protein HPDFL43_04420 [Hoeflea phototrophica DFL-43]
MMMVFRDLEIRRLVVALLFAPLLLASFFSAHTMPRISGDGIGIIICTGEGTASLGLSLDLDRAPGPDQGDQGDTPAHTPCDWAMQMHPAAVSSAVPTLAVIPLGLSETQAFERILLSAGGVHSSRFARAPPRLS